MFKWAHALGPRRIARSDRRIGEVGGNSLHTIKLRGSLIDHLNCQRIGTITVLCGFLLGTFPTPTRAQTTIISATGPQVGSAGIFPSAWVAFSFTIGQAYSHVTIRANLVGSFGGTAFLMTRVGPGTTVGDEIASGPFISSAGPSGVGQFQPVFEDVSLPSGGTYIVVLSTTETHPPQGLVTTNVPTIVADVGASNAPFMTTLIPPGTVGVSYPPAASFFVNPTRREFIGEYEVTGTPSVISVTIDIKPGSFPNSINLDASGAIPVAIFSTPTFNAAAEIDPNTLTLAGASVKMVGRGSRYQCGAEDLNGDGLADLVCHFINELTAQPGDSSAMLEGQTFGGVTIHGEDSIRIVPQ